MRVKVLDASALHEGIEKQSSKFKEQQESIKKLKSEIDNLVNLNDAFKGEAGDSIRAFYKDFHGKFLTYYTSTLENYVKVLKNVKEATTELESDPSGYISESFLSNDLTNGLDNGRNLTVGLVNDANSSISSVNDILHAPTIQDDRFLSYHQQAQKEITDTVEKLNKYDSTQSKSLESVIEEIQFLEKIISDISGVFSDSKIELGNYNSWRSKDTHAIEELKKEINNKRKSELAEDVLLPFEAANTGMGWGDNLLLGYHSLTTLSAGLLTRKLKVNYFGGKPKLWNLIRGKYEFSLKMDDSWTSKSKHSSKLAKKIINFSKAPTPQNPLLKQAQKFVQSYESPSHLYKHVAGFPKNIHKSTGKLLKSNIISRVTTGSKELLETAAKSKGLINTARRIPFVGNVVTVASNAGEIFNPNNPKSGISERIGRFIGGVGTDLFAVGAGAQVGATIGSVGGPIGIVIGGAVGGAVGGFLSTKYGEKVKNVTGKIGKEIGEKTKKVAKKLGKVKDSVLGWFN